MVSTTLRLLALLAALLFPSWVGAQPGFVGPPNAIICNQVAFLNAGASAITQIVGASTSGQRILICGWQITNTAASGTFFFSYGTGTNCGGTPIALTPVSSVSTTPVQVQSPYAFLQTPANNALCITPSVSTISSMVFFTLF